MLGLTHQIPGDNLRIGLRIGNHHRFGRSGEHVDADPAEQDALGLGDELVAGADQDIRLGAAKQPEGKGSDPLHTPQAQNPISPAKPQRVQDRRRNPDAGTWRRTGGDMAYPGNRGGCHGHDRRGDMRIAPARHVSPGSIDRKMLVPRQQAGDHFHLGVVHRRLLCFGEAAHIVMGEADIVAQALRHLVGGSRQPVGGDNDIAVPFIEFQCIGAGHRVATGLDLVQHGLHQGAHIRLARGRGLFGLLQKLDRHRSPSFHASFLA